MSILGIDDIFYEIINHIHFNHLKTIVSLVIINKGCHHFIINLNIYKELNVLQKRFPNFHDYKRFGDAELLCELNLVNILKKEFVSIYYSKNIFNEIIIGASKHGRVNLLEWFYDSGYKFKNCKIAMRIAMQNGQVDVIKWFCDRNYRIKFSKRYTSILAEKTISEHKYPWFYNEDNIYKYTESDVRFLIRNDYFVLLKWLFELDDGFKLSDILIECIIVHDRIHILDWIKDKGLDFQYSPNVLEDSCYKDNINVLELFQKNKIIIKITTKLVVRATVFGYIDVLNFLNAHEIDYYHLNNNVNYICISEFKHFKNFVYSISWIDLQHSSYSCNIAGFIKYECSLNWYTQSGFNLGQIEWIQRMKIVKYRDTVQFSW